MWSIWLQSVVWWSTDDAKKRKLYAERGISTVRANVTVLPVMLHQIHRTGQERIKEDNTLIIICSNTLWRFLISNIHHLKVTYYAKCTFSYPVNIIMCPWCV